jgi:ABC-type glycerol-3-phosphate transport system substrate-binding protein
LVNADGSLQYPKTWAELAETAKKIKDATGAAGIDLLAKDGAGGWHFSNIAWAFGATPLTIDNGDGTYTSNLNTPEAIEAMEYVKSLRWEYDVLTADPTNEDWGTGWASLATGTVAMYIGANDGISQLSNNGLKDANGSSLVPMPAGPRGDQYSLYGGTPYVFSRNASDAQVDAALNYLTIMGKSPELSDDAVKGLRDDAQYRVDNGIPVIPAFPLWTDKARLDLEQSIVEEYSNVNMALFNDYFSTIQKSGNLHPEEPGLTQDMYSELTNVLQAVITDKNADVAALMATANSNYQAILDANQ